MLKLLRIHPILLPKIAYGIFYYCCVLIENIYIKNFHFSETLKRQSLKIWSHINSTLHQPFTCKLKRLGKDNYHSGATTLSIASLRLNLVKRKFNNAVYIFQLSRFAYQSFIRVPAEEIKPSPLDNWFF
jgi:hypothetical protein